MPSRPLDPCIIHPLPAAPVFLGREVELAQLRTFWDNDGRGVLCLVGLGGAARAARDLDEREVAQRAVNEGLHLARIYGLGLYHIEMLCLQGEISLARGDGPAAERLAREALWRATAKDCQFAWGEIEARQLLDKALAVQRH